MIRITKRLILTSMLGGTVLAAMVATTLAAPAPWFQWRSKLNKAVTCMQISPGEGWAKHAGPFRDPHCKHAGRPGA